MAEGRMASDRPLSHDIASPMPYGMQFRGDRIGVEKMMA